MKPLLFAVLLGAVGLIAGYLLFAQFNGQLIPVKDLLMPSKNILDDIGKALTGTEKIRQNILICGGAGAVAGFLIGIFSGKKR